MRDDASLWCWGANYAGQLGDGTTTHRAVSARVGTDNDWRDVFAGESSACATKSTGALHCWGGTPEPVDTEAWTRAATYSHQCGIRVDGSLWCWGDNTYGQLGTGNKTAVYTPTRVGAASWREVTNGVHFTCGIQRDGTLWCWGSSYDVAPQRLGTDADWTGISGREGDVCGVRANGTVWCWEVAWSTTPNPPVQIGTGTDWAQVSTGMAQKCGLKRDKTLWCWDTDTPEQVGSFADWDLVAVGGGFACARRVGKTYCWGQNGYGQVGNGRLAVTNTPGQVGTDADWKSLGVGVLASCALKTTGAVYCFGNDFGGVLGNGGAGTATVDVPSQVGTATDFLALAMRDQQVLALRGAAGSGTLWRWGTPQRGQPGADTPVQIGTDASWRAIAAGWEHGCALKTDDTLWCWGRNDHLETGSATASATPVQVGTDTDWQQVAAGGDHTCAIKAGGTLWCWGSNAQAQLGQGTQAATDTATPTRVGAETTWAFVAASGDANCGVLRDGRGFCWAGSYNWMFDPRPGVTVTSPTQIPGNWRVLVPGNLGTAGIKTDGTLWWAGRSKFGRVQSSAYTERPFQVGTATNWSHVDGNSQGHVCGTRTDGTLWCWGDGTAGQLGQGGTWVPTPTEVQ